MKLSRSKLRKLILQEMAGSMTMEHQVSTIYSDLASVPDGLLQQMLMIVMENANIGVLEYGGGFEYRALRNGVEDFINTGIFDTAGEAKELDGIIRNILVGRIFPELEGNPRSVRLQELSMIIQDVLQKLDLLKYQESPQVEKQPMQYYRGDADDPLMNEVMVGFPDDRAPFDADAALKSAKKKMSKEPALASMFQDSDDYASKRQAYSLGALTTDLTDDEELAADIASDKRALSPGDPQYDFYFDPFDEESPESIDFDPDSVFDHTGDDKPIEQPLQGMVKDMLPKLEISGHRKNNYIGQEVTYYLTPDKKYQVVMSERPRSRANEYNIDVRKFNPEWNGYEAGNMGRYSDGTRAFFRSVMYASNFRNALEELNTHLKSLGAL
jgi:hypothetical protein